MNSKNIYQILRASVSCAVLSLVIVGSIYAASGDLDITFGISGKVITQAGGNQEARAVAIQPDGKIVAAVHTVTTTPDQIVLVRHNPDGSIDQSFGNGGSISEFAHGGHHTYFNAVAIQPDGKIVAAGYFFESGGCTGERPWVVRYNADGTRDTTFGNVPSAPGTVEFMFDFCPPGVINALALQSNGKIVVAGWSKNASGKLDAGVARLNSNGTLDTSFSGDGIFVNTSGTTGDAANAVAVTPTGRIIFAGYTGDGTALSNNARVYALTSNGTIDTAFSAPFGSAIIDFAGKDDRLTSLVIQPDGKVLAGGYATGSNVQNPQDARFLLIRWNANGLLDTTFGSGGTVTTNMSIWSDSVNALLVQPDGKIVAAGNHNSGDSANIALVRYNANGSLDIPFGINGKQSTEVYGYTDSGRGVALQADGKIVVAGTASNGMDTDIVLLRYLP